MIRVYKLNNKNIHESLSPRTVITQPIPASNWAITETTMFSFSSCLKLGEMKIILLLLTVTVIFQLVCVNALFVLSIILHFSDKNKQQTFWN
jgi:hypothetical protein